MMSTAKDKNPFRVPENYFEEVNRKILATAAGTPKVNKPGLFHRLRPALAAAAAMAVLVTAGYLTVKLTGNKADNTTISELLSVDPELLIDELDMAVLENDADIQSAFDEEPGLSDDEIIDYLVTEDIDISEIYEKL